MCYLYFFCLHYLINIHIFDYPDSRLSGLLTQVPPSPDNRGSTVKSGDHEFTVCGLKIIIVTLTLAEKKIDFKPTNIR